MENKIKIFEAFVFELLKWYKKEKGDYRNNDLSKLKTLKLLFLWVSRDKELLKIFNNFQAWTYGPVEKDIYDAIVGKGEGLTFFEVTNSKTIKKPLKVQIDADNQKIAEKIVSELKDRNKKLINKNALTLVNITHMWESWKLTYEFGWNMEESLILSDKWFFGES